MRRVIVLLGSLAVSLASVVPRASADAPLQDRLIDSGSFTFGAGEVCDFDYRYSFDTTVHVIVRGTREDPQKLIAHLGIEATHTNLDTGASLTERSSYHQLLHVGGPGFRSVGSLQHLWTAAGRNLLLAAGQVWFAPDLVGPIRSTPHAQPGLPDGNAGTICRALGGAPA